MYDSILHALLKKYDAEYAAASSLFSMASGSIVTVTLTIPDGYVAYQLMHGGYTNKSDILAEWIDAQGGILFTWDEFPDSYFQDYQLPLTEKAHEHELVIRFTNASTETAVVMIMQSLVMLPKRNHYEFESSLLKLAEI
jgi:hypothetical protein